MICKRNKKLANFSSEIHRKTVERERKENMKFTVPDFNCCQCDIFFIIDFFFFHFSPIRCIFICMFIVHLCE